MDLTRLHHRMALAGALAALVMGGLLAFALVRGHRGERAAPPPASQGGLVIDPSGAHVGQIDEARPLRCFVEGRLAGELTLAECAKRNGVATEALGVGLDASGAPAAAQAGAAAVTPLPPPQAAATPAPSAPAQGLQRACWTYAGGAWRRLPGDTSLNGCVQALFAGRCERPGEALYGRFGEQTLRLVPGRVEISGDNHSFRTLAEQGAGCSIPTGG
jgi:hypothetical protein